jgi:hypothetical protein
MEIEFNIDSSTNNQFIDFELTPSLCKYKIILFSETEDENVFTLLDKNGQCPNGIVNGPVKDLCVQHIKELSDLELDLDQIKFWFLDDSTDIITIYYAACIQGHIDERWFHIKELKDIPMITEDYDLIKKLYRYVTKKNIE